MYLSNPLFRYTDLDLAGSPAAVVYLQVPNLSRHAPSRNNDVQILSLHGLFEIRFAYASDTWVTWMSRALGLGRRTPSKVWRHFETRFCMCEDFLMRGE